MIATSITNQNEKYHLTPIGPVPIDFDFMPDLLAAAFIGYRDELITHKTRDGKTEQEACRSWYIVKDPGMVPSIRTTAAGKRMKDESRMVTSCSRHRKFCMLTDFVRHVLEQTVKNVDQASVLRIAIGKQSTYQTPAGGMIDIGEQVNALRMMDSRTLQNTLAKRGVQGYTQISAPDELSF